jgi:hypothetical protein
VDHRRRPLAHGMQATLVLTLSLQIDRFEVYGKSIPGTEMGGDLILRQPTRTPQRETKDGVARVEILTIVALKGSLSLLDRTAA